MSSTNSDNQIQFYQDAPHDCSYIAGRQAQNIYPDPNKPMTNHLYSQLIAHGFRRSGDHSYRPNCGECQSCVPVRINTKKFKLSRSQRRCLSRNKTLSRTILPAEFKREHYDLYCRYLTARHVGGGMDNPTIESYSHFLISDWSETRFIEFREEGKLISVAVTDIVENSLSALYTFFDPDFEARSLGTYSILQQINLAQELGLTWLYLGYWIEDCQKMKYKQNFSGLEGYIEQDWQALKS
ncbi:MAG: arginyltransferase [Gammaproteobacteria bacterium]|nr:MAG: arginyltransferase [Gammaproteobacteria bacterium]